MTNQAHSFGLYPNTHKEGTRICMHTHICKIADEMFCMLKNQRVLSTLVKNTIKWHFEILLSQQKGVGVRNVVSLLATVIHKKLQLHFIQIGFSVW